MPTCLWPGTQKLFGLKRRKLVTTSLLLHFNDGFICLSFWNEFFSHLFQFIGWSNLVLYFYGNVCNWIPKLIGLQMDYFCGFFLEDGFFHWLHICMDWNLHEMVKLVFFMTSSLFDNSFGGYFGLIFKCACTFQQWDFLISIDKL